MVQLINAKYSTASEKSFQANLEVILPMSYSDTMAEQHFYIRWPESGVYCQIRVMWRGQDLVHKQLQDIEEEVHMIQHSLSILTEQSKKGIFNPMKKKAYCVGTVTSMSNLLDY